MNASIMINVADVQASSQWYQRLLGCQSGHGGPDFEMLVDGEELLVMLHRSSADHHPSSPVGDAPLGVGVCLYIRVSDIQSVAHRASEMGVAHEGVRHNELAHQEELELRDPDGYFVTVCGPASWAKAP